MSVPFLLKCNAVRGIASPSETYLSTNSFPVSKYFFATRIETGFQAPSSIQSLVPSLFSPCHCTVRSDP